jgi:hypothetical protein
MEGYYCEICDDIMGIIAWMKHDPKHTGRHILWTFLSRRHIEKEIEDATMNEILDGQEMQDQETLDQELDESEPIGKENVSEGKPK